jgi:hypothetical protein
MYHEERSSGGIWGVLTEKVGVASQNMWEYAGNIYRQWALQS